MLTEEEKREIIILLRKDLPLPEKYRTRLFSPSKQGKPDDPCLEAYLLEEHYPVLPDGSSSPADNPSWHNRLFWGDNLDILQFLLSNDMREALSLVGKIKLIYIDPPFNAGVNFHINYQKSSHTYSPFAYRDIWENGVDGYLEWLSPRLCLMRELLADDGCIFVHCDWRLNTRLRLLLDDIFHFYVNEIIWHYTGGGRSQRFFSRKHDSIFIYTKSRIFNFYPDQIRVPYASTSAYAKKGITARSGKKYLPNPLGAVPDDVWDIPIINPLSHERNAYPTQKPVALLERIILSCTKPGELVADFFCGSGVSAAAAEKLGRKWLISDIGFPAVHLSGKRLHKLLHSKSSALPSPTPFSVWTITPPDWTHKKLPDASLSPLHEENDFLLAQREDEVWLIFSRNSVASWEKISQILNEHSFSYNNIFVLASSYLWDCLEQGKMSGIWQKTRFHLLNLPSYVNIQLSPLQQYGPALFPAFRLHHEEGQLALEMTDLQWGADFLKYGLICHTEKASKNAVKRSGFCHWKDLLGSWAVDPCLEFSVSQLQNQTSLVFKPLWQSGKSPANRSPQLLSPLMSYRQMSQIAIKVTDIFFNENMIFLNEKITNQRDFSLAL